ncbi:unnamed protein product, partial [Pylaiella littoralis]
AAPVVGATPGPVAPVVPSAGLATVYAVEIFDDQTVLDVQALADAEGNPTSDTTASVQFSATLAERAEYEMYFVSPIPGAAVTGNLQVTVTAQLGDSAVAGEWKVDLYNRATDVFDPIGVDNTLTGVSSGQWTTVTKTTSSLTPGDYVEAVSNQLLVRIYTETSGVQTIYVDQVLLFVDGTTPAPVPAPTTAPSDSGNVQVD